MILDRLERPYNLQKLIRIVFVSIAFVQMNKDRPITLFHVQDSSRNPFHSKDNTVIMSNWPTTRTRFPMKGVQSSRSDKTIADPKPGFLRISRFSEQNCVIHHDKDVSREQEGVRLSGTGMSTSLRNKQVPSNVPLA